MKTFLKIGLIVFIIGIVGSIGFGLWAYPELKKEEEVVDKVILMNKMLMKAFI